MVKKIILSLFVLFTFMVGISQAQEAASQEQTLKSDAFIPAGTMIPLELMSPVSSKTTFVGEILTVNVLEDIVVNNVAVINKDSQGYVKVVAVDKTGKYGKSGAIAVEPLYVKTVNSIVVPLTGQVTTKGSGHSAIGFEGGAGAGNWWPDKNVFAGALCLLFTDSSTGGDATITAGTKIMAVATKNVDLGASSEELWNAINVDVLKKKQATDNEKNKQNWTGEYSTMYGKVSLKQLTGSSSVFGSIENDIRMLEGTVVGDRLIGKWKKYKNNNVDETGYFEFMLNTERTQLFAVWRNENSNRWVKDTYATVLNNW